MPQLDHDDLETIVKTYLDGNKSAATQLVSQFAEDHKYRDDKELQQAHKLLQEGNAEEAFRILERESDLRIHAGDAGDIGFSDRRGKHGDAVSR